MTWIFTTFGDSSTSTTFEPVYSNATNGTKILSSFKGTTSVNNKPLEQVICSGDYQGSKCDYENFLTGVKIPGVS